MIRWDRYRKTLAAAGLGLVELAAYVAADPRNLPSWVVSVALAVNALAVLYVRNAPPPRVAPTLFARERVRDRDEHGGYPSGDTPASELRPPHRPRE